MILWLQVAAGLWMGDLARPYRDEFDHVVTISTDPPLSANGVRHLHVQPPTDIEQIPAFLDVVLPWIQARWFVNRSLLVQSPGCGWSELIVAALYVDMGATADEAILSLRQVKPRALTEPIFIGQLRSREVRHA